VYGGFGTRKALVYNFLSAITAVAGALVTYLLVEGSKIQILAELLVPFVAGGFIYIATIDLMPELHERTQVKDSAVQLVTLLLGIALMLLLSTWLPQH
jgi:zinc and cadmium transporter